MTDIINSIHYRVGVTPRGWYLDQSHRDYATISKAMDEFVRRRVQFFGERLAEGDDEQSIAQEIVKQFRSFIFSNQTFVGAGTDDPRNFEFLVSVLSYKVRDEYMLDGIKFDKFGMVSYE
jgi:hypothetical protein